jgi:hypothetical protein
MDEKEGRSLVTQMLAWNSVHHMRSMSDHIKPESPGHLLLGKICATHMDHRLPMRLNKAVGQLVFCGSSDNFGVRVNEILTDSHTKKFNFAIAVEAMHKRSSRGPEEAMSSKD